MKDKTRESYYVNIPAFILDDTDLSDSEKVLYGRIDGLSNNKDKPYCFASNSYLAEKSGKTERTIIRYINNLVDKGYIHRELIINNDGKVEERKLWTMDKYLLEKERVVTPATGGTDKNDTTHHDKNVTTPHDRNVTYNNKDINTKDTNTKDYILSNKNFDEEFEQIWELYPNKKGKARAKKSYIRDRKNGASKEEVKQGVVDYAQHIKILKREPQYIQHGSTFFSNQAWADDWTAPGGATTRASVPVADVNHYAGSEIDEALKELLEEYGVPITQGMTEETAMRALAEVME